MSLAGTGIQVHLETQAQRWGGGNPLDTVIEIVDGNGNRYATCREPGDTSTNFSSACINDDIGGSPPVLDSALDFQVSGATNSATTFYVHVLDWRGNARPDMNYVLGLRGRFSIEHCSDAASSCCSRTPLLTAVIERGQHW